ncbi:MAG TPA: SGNH/GDSL hydrolase family protein [Vicinamibacteria bacterium]|nr:SGNH/GDSL hydrolase family protein [Vicinamibacteria bacterium]
MRRPAFIALAAVFLGPAAVRADAQTNFTTYVAVGDSLAAGFESGSLVETHQNRSAPALIARQAGVQGFQQPLVSEPGIPPELTLVSLVPVPVIAPKAATSGAPKNLALARPYNNLAVPGATTIDALTRTTDAGGLHDLILRGLGTQVQQAVALRPTAITLWIGNNDVLGAALRGRAIDGVTLTPTATFRATYGQIVAALKTTGAFIVAANLPDVTAIPFVTTIRPYVVNPSTGAPVLIGGARVPLIGPSGSLPSTALVTLAASTLLGQGIGIPTALGGTGAPLPDEVVLDPSEIAIIQDHVAANNQAIREICGAANIPVLDVNAVLRELATTGRHIGGITLNGAFLVGGVFSYDGIHPNDVGYALVANEFIRVINANGGSLPPVDLGAVLGVTGASAGGVSASAQRPSSSEGVPFEFSMDAYANLLEAFPRLDRR